MLYLLDANTLIDSKRDFYQLDKVPEFWEWLEHHGNLGNIKIPYEIYDEFADAKKSDGTRDALAEWAANDDVKKALLLDEEADSDLVSRVTYGGYLPNPSDEDLVKVGNDPFLISYALADPDNRCVVTGEVSKPRAQGANRQVPDVCNNFGVKWMHYFQFFRTLDFSTSWNK